MLGHISDQIRIVNTLDVPGLDRQLIARALADLHSHYVRVQYQMEVNQ
jgi:hypothetical protein